jgi:hypothetical protein
MTKVSLNSNAEEWRGKSKQCFEGLTVVSLVMCTESSAVGGMVGGGHYFAVHVMEKDEQQRHNRQTCVIVVER